MAPRPARRKRWPRRWRLAPRAGSQARARASGRGDRRGEEREEERRGEEQAVSLAERMGSARSLAQRCSRTARVSDAWGGARARVACRARGARSSFAQFTVHCLRQRAKGRGTCKRAVHASAGPVGFVSSRARLRADSTWPRPRGEQTRYEMGHTIHLHAARRACAPSCLGGVCRRVERLESASLGLCHMHMTQHEAHHAARVSAQSGALDET